MSRILAIDYGIKRTGIAVTDPLRIIASALDTVDTNKLFGYLDNYFSKESVEIVVVGEPKQLDNNPSQSAEMINKFIENFKSKYPNIELERIDERFTSKIAFQSMIDNGFSKKKRQDKGMIDQIAATIILQDYLSRL